MKVVISGETFDYDDDKMLMSEALWVESVYGRRYAEWETERLQGEAKAMAVFCCLAWRRAGREVDVAAVLAGEVDFSISEVFESIAAAYAERAASAKAAEGNPTSGAVPLTEADGTDTTPAATRGSSRSGSTSARGKSAS